MCGCRNMKTYLAAGWPSVAVCSYGGESHASNKYRNGAAGETAGAKARENEAAHGAMRSAEKRSCALQAQGEMAQSAVGGGESAGERGSAKTEMKRGGNAWLMASARRTVAAGGMAAAGMAQWKHRLQLAEDSSVVDIQSVPSMNSISRLWLRLTLFSTRKPITAGYLSAAALTKPAVPAARRRGVTAGCAINARNDSLAIRP